MQGRLTRVNHFCARQEQLSRIKDGKTSGIGDTASRPEAAERPDPPQLMRNSGNSTTRTDSS